VKALSDKTSTRCYSKPVASKKSPEVTANYISGPALPTLIFTSTGTDRRDTELINTL